MSSRENLEELLRRKDAVRKRIVEHRSQYAAAAAVVARPLVWIDRSVEIGRVIAPFIRLAAVPGGLWLLRGFFPRSRIVRIVLRWGLPLLAAVRAIKSRRNPCAGVRRKSASTATTAVRRHAIAVALTKRDSGGVTPYFDGRDLGT